MGDYEVDSVQMMNNQPVSDIGLVSGGAYMSHYEQKDEVAELKQKLDTRSSVTGYTAASLSSGSFVRYRRFCGR